MAMLIWVFVWCTVVLLVCHEAAHMVFIFLMKVFFILVQIKKLLLQVWWWLHYDRILSRLFCGDLHPHEGNRTRVVSGQEPQRYSQQHSYLHLTKQGGFMWGQLVSFDVFKYWLQYNNQWRVLFRWGRFWDQISAEIAKSLNKWFKVSLFGIESKD